MGESVDVWKPFGLRLLGFKTTDEGDGKVRGTGLLGPIVSRLNLPVIMYLQSRFYAKYNVGTWKGKRVANPFAPPVGSHLNSER